MCTVSAIYKVEVLLGITGYINHFSKQYQPFSENSTEHEGKKQKPCTAVLRNGIQSFILSPTVPLAHYFASYPAM